MKKNLKIYWITTILLILWEGLMPVGTLLFAPDQATVGTRALGYPDYFAYTLIFCKVLGVVAISIPSISGKLKEWAYAGLAFNLIYAFLSHAFVDQNMGYMVLPLVVLGILMLSYKNNPKIHAYGQVIIKP